MIGKNLPGSWHHSGRFPGGGLVPRSPHPDLTLEARQLFVSWGILSQFGLGPDFLYTWQAALTVEGLLSLILGGFLVGFGTRWANGCTSGHTIMGLSLLNPGSLVATFGFFAGGALVSWFIVPLILSL